MPTGSSRKGCLHVNHRKSLPFPPLTPFQKEVLTGELLADGCIRSRLSSSSHSRASARWRFKHKEHVDLLSEIFSNYHPRVNYYTNAWELDLQSSDLWNEWRSYWYPNGKKVLPDSIMLTPITCFHWFIGDGSLDRPCPRKNSRRIRLACMGFGEKVGLLQYKLREIGFNFSITKSNDLRGSAKEWRDFLNFITYRQIPKCYAYKWGLEVEASL